MVKQKLPILLKPIKQSYDFLEIFTDLVVSLRIFFATFWASLAWHIDLCLLVGTVGPRDYLHMFHDEFTNQFTSPKLGTVVF
jgi:hypothetical protein